MPHATLDRAYVLLCDWRGNCRWTSDPSLPLQAGQQVWEHLVPESQETTRQALGHVVTLREAQQIEIVNEHGDLFRTWLWPLDSPEMAVCVLALRVPRELQLLTQRERECLALLAEGLDTRMIAERLKVSLSTVHTHMKRAREKLELPTVEGLISFAARFCYPQNGSLHSGPH